MVGFLFLMLRQGASVVYADPNGSRPEWRAIVYSHRLVPVAYRISGFGYSLAGATIIYQCEKLRAYDEGFLWSVLGACLVLQGPVSYMSDVWSWGRHDMWSTIWTRLDPLMASTLFVICTAVIGYRAALGLFAVPISTISIWNAGSVIALVSKAMAARCSRRFVPECDEPGCVSPISAAQCEEILAWHTMWHSLPVVATFCVLDLALGWTFQLADATLALPAAAVHT